MKRLKVLIVGSGGREHALAWKIKQSKKVKQLYLAPGNGGTARLGENVEIKADDIQALADWAEKQEMDLTVVGPELPLCLGIVDEFRKRGLKVFGPDKFGAQLEGSKVWAKRFMKRFKIPTADFKVFDNYLKAKKYLQTARLPLVVKADGLAAGKGVVVCQNRDKALEAIELIMKDKQLGKAGEKVVIEECLQGQEASIIGLTDGKTIKLLMPSQDHKAIYENDQGPNTGGMGVYAPTPMVNEQTVREVEERVMKPVIQGMRRLGREYKGVLYAGIMLTDKGVKVLEFNCRFGDPETQPQLMMLKSDLVELMEAVIEGRLKEKKIENYKGAAVCVVMASGGYPGKYKTGYEIKGLGRRLRKEAVVFEAGTKLVKGKTVTDGGRVLGVTSRGRNLEEAIKKAYQRVEEIKFKDSYYRRDIGAKALAWLEESRKVNRIVVKDKLKERSKKPETWKSYVVNKKIKREELEKIGLSLINPVAEEYEINQMSLGDKFGWVAEIGFLPGVTDNVGNTVKEGIEDLLGVKFASGEGVYSSEIRFFKEKLTRKQLEKKVGELYNPLIKRVQIKSAAEFKKEKGLEPMVAEVKLKGGSRVQEVNLEVDDKALIKLGKEGIRDKKTGKRRGPLALDLEYLKTIREYFRKEKRQPTDIELESLAQTWSEHCKHTIFANPLDEIKEGLFKKYIKGATEEIRRRQGKKDICVSVFKDNSGAIELDEDYLITDKVETHNSPSALDPFGGAITGIVGVNRDTMGFGLGAKPIINRYGFCFNDPEDNSKLYKGKGKTQEMLSSRRIMDGVVRGVNSGGNCSGIPTTQGFVYFDKSYQGKPLVFVGTVGLIPKKSRGRKAWVKKAKPGDYVVMVGGRVGLDGIHGATFSSEAMDEGSPASAVQIGDPITQKKLSDALVKEARDLGLYDSITDNGAGGLSCSVAEMAKEAGGCEVELDKVPVKYPGLEPWQIWVSESQERMTLAVAKDKWQEFERLMARRGVEATIIGRFTKKTNCVVKLKGKKIMDIKMKFLHEGLPQRQLTTKVMKPTAKPVKQLSKDLNQEVLKRLRGLNIASFEYISQQYDHEVQGGSVIKPLQGRNKVNGEVTVVRPVLTSKKGVVLSQGLWPEMSLSDCYQMAAKSIDTAVRNAVAAGASLDKLALVDNFCWCSSDEPERLYQLKRAAQACYDYALAYGTPFISGKDSMFNDFKGFDEKGKSIKISVLPTLLISSLGIIEDIDKAVSLDLKLTGDLVYVLGEAKREVEAKTNLRLYRALEKAIKQELIASSLSVTRGGLAIALLKKAMAGGLGLKLVWQSQAEELLAETSGQVVVTVSPKNKLGFERLMTGKSFKLLGKVINQPKVMIKDKKGKKTVDLSIKQALRSYKARFKGF